MITPYLEKLIHDGIAQYRTYAMGGSGVGTIPVGESQYVVITNFIWCPFSDQAIIDDPKLGTDYCLHTMRFRSQKKEMYHNFRDSYQVLAASLGVFYPYFNPPAEYNTYFVGVEPVQIDIWKFGAERNWPSTNFSAVPLSTNEPKSPAGYGQVDAIRRITTMNLADIVNMGVKRDPGANPRTGKQRDEFFDDIIPITGIEQTSLQDPAASISSGQYNYPLVTLGYVVVNKMPDKHLM